jgi:polysaccharide export outer membrane protein
MKNIIKYFMLISFLVSCKPKKDMIYVSQNIIGEEITKAKYQRLYIQQSDVLLILVSALDEVAVKPFNLNTMNRVGSESPNGANLYVQPSEYLVNEEGYINFPVLGDIYVKGITQVQLKAELESRLMKYLTEPLVTISLKNFNVSVLGEVKIPGQKQSFTQKLNVFQALSLAGDMTDFGDRTKVKLIRTSDSGEDQVVNLDLSRSDIVNSSYYYIKQNDVLYVEPDKNKQILANSNPNRALIFQIVASVLGVATLIVALTK